MTAIFTKKHVSSLYNERDQVFCCGFLRFTVVMSISCSCGGGRDIRFLSIALDCSCRNPGGRHKPGWYQSTRIAKTRFWRISSSCAFVFDLQ